MAVAITQTANPSGVSSSSNVATYSGVSIGTASANRIVVVKGASTTQIRLTCFGYETKGGVTINILLPDGRLITTSNKDFHINFQM